MLNYIPEGLVRNDVVSVIPIQNTRASGISNISKQQYVGPERKVHIVSCARIIEGDQREIADAMALDRRKSELDLKIPNIQFLNWTKNCDSLKLFHGFTHRLYEDIERSLRIAYIILMYDSPEQAVRMIRSIYSPFNIYCIHVDKSSSDDIKKEMTSFAKCFSNVFLVSNPVDVISYHFTRLQADLHCMSDIVKKNGKWKYFINLPNTEFPLKTNLEIVKILNIYNGANDIEGITKPSRMMGDQIKYSFILKNGTIFKTKKIKSKPPHGIKIVRGSAYGVFSSSFIRFVLADKRARDFLEWTKDTMSPDEYFWATLNHNPHLNAPGHYTGVPDNKPWLAAYAALTGRDRCKGKFRDGKCVFGLGDLNELVQRKELFANKFLLTYQPLAYECMEEWIYNKTFNKLPLETYYYKQLPFIRK
ncbi:hypothetical protein FSP39_004506 [Pinctada imbricata]|uniref:Uncharacterized protein n=1 Tax=Pinctada imbricata TaxID=66713 RepID=A0AA88XTE6_PINIB|nr:hypothetical protein FSP39_004506 [Pinctada imbricata]